MVKVVVAVHSDNNILTTQIVIACASLCVRACVCSLTECPLARMNTYV